MTDRETAAAVFPSPDAQWAFWGWFYGYPKCCVAAFIAQSHDESWRDEEQIFHPERGHILCPGCRDGTLATLPPRPADDCPVEFLSLGEALGGGGYIWLEGVEMAGIEPAEVRVPA